MDKTTENNNDTTLNSSESIDSSFSVIALNNDDLTEMENSANSSAQHSNFSSLSRVDSSSKITSKADKNIFIRSIQVGINHSLTKELGSTIDRDVLMKDFTTLESTVFKCDGNDADLQEFTFKTYAPVAFRYFRFKFGIHPDDYLMSFCNSPLRELPNPGSSGSIFFITWDDEFIMKTIKQKESKFLRGLLPGYLLNLNQNPYTLLPKFFGFYCYKHKSKYIRFVAMNNFIPSNIKIHQKYDLKGSTYNRMASKAEKMKTSPTFKDLDFKEHHPNGIFLEPATYKLLIEIIQKDCRVLESFKIMDYSLLLGVHNVDLAQKEKEELSAERLCNHVENNADASSRAPMSRQTSKTVQNGLTDNSAFDESNHADIINYSDKDFILSRNGIPATSGNGEKLLLFIGIIDIMESYGIKKKVERTLKSVLHDGDTVSIHRPKFYVQRFLKFIETFLFKKSAHSRLSKCSIDRSTPIPSKPSSPVKNSEENHLNDLGFQFFHHSNADNSDGEATETLNTEDTHQDKDSKE